MNKGTVKCDFMLCRYCGSKNWLTECFSFCVLHVPTIHNILHNNLRGKCLQLKVQLCFKAILN